MTTYQFRFEPILQLQEQQKNQTESAYKESIEQFEETATQLYDLLKKKEDLLGHQRTALETGFAIEQLQNAVHYLERLERSIDEAQRRVIEQRARMDWYENKLLEDTIEVKKYEKMKDQSQARFRAEQLYQEAQQLDELSTQQFARKRGANA